MKKNIVAKMKSVMLMLLSLAVLQACDISYYQNDTVGKISVSVSLEEAKMTVPGLSQDEFSFVINGSGPDGATFKIETEQGVSSAIVDNLIFGSWDITIEALYIGGSEPVSFGDGTATTMVYPGSTSLCSVSIVPFNGRGYFDISVSWDAASVSDPRLEGTLSRTGYDPVNISFSMSSGHATSSVELDSGIYSLVLVLYDGESYQFGGAADSIRITNALTTTGTYTIVGEAESDIQSPTVPGNLVATETLAYHVSLSWTASTDNIAVTGYRIYRNGTSIGTSASTSFTDSSVMESTTYSYTVTAYDAIGNESGQSGTLNVTTPESTSGVTINLTNVDITAPSSRVKLCFIHHSTGSQWINSGYGKLGPGLNQANYYVTECDYGWNAEPNDNLGNKTDTGNWPLWFNDIKMPYVYGNSSHYDYDNTISDPGGENTIIMFKSCFPNSEVGSSIDDEKAIYNNILGYFKNHTDKLFILVIPPPEIEISSSTLTRELANWLADYQNGWLATYPEKNVFAFDYYNILTDPNNHHRVEGNNIVHTVTTSPANPAHPNELYYYSGTDSHPTGAGHQKATSEFVPFLNAVYNYWRK